MTLDPVFNWIIALALIQLFASAAWHKLSNLETFTSTLTSYQVVPFGSTRAVVYSVIALEAIAALSLAIPDYRALGAALACLLLTSYGLAMSMNLLKGKHLADCGCHFGPQKQPVSWFLVIRNGLLVALAFLLVIPTETRSLTPLDFGTILFGLALCPLIYAISNSLSQTHELLKNG